MGKLGRKKIGQAVAWQCRDATTRDATIIVQDQQFDVLRDSICLLPVHATAIRVS